MTSFLYELPTLWIAVNLFVLMIAANLAAYYLQQRESRRHPDQVSEGLGPVEGSLLGLLALLLSFTFGMSASKNDTQRQVIVQEANNISTAILRCDLYPENVRKELRLLFNSYLNARIAYYNAGVDENQINITLQLTNDCSAKIWKRVTELSQNKENTLRTQQMVPALNDMMGIVTTRDINRTNHIPESILYVLFILTLAGSFITGYGSKGKRYNWVMVSSFSLMTVITIYLILDLDRPRRGIINMDNTHQRIIELKSLLKDN